MRIKFLLKRIIIIIGTDRLHSRDGSILLPSMPMDDVWGAEETGVEVQIYSTRWVPLCFVTFLSMMERDCRLGT